MKIRAEISGLHLFDRVSGLHVLMDEIEIPAEQCNIAPRTVSIAITNVCDLKCRFCYAPKTRHTLSLPYLKRLAKRLDDLGALEITLGGGEPLLYPEFAQLCNWVWENTSLGISITTHGHHLTDDLISKLEGKVSCLQISIDGVEPRYSEVRGRPLDALLNILSAIRHRIPFGINTVVSPGRVSELEGVIDLAVGVGACNVLIIPEHHNGSFVISTGDWLEIDECINKNQRRIQLNVTHAASNFLHSWYLETENQNEFVFAHISADNKLRTSSYGNGGILIEDLDLLEYYLRQVRYGYFN